MSGISTKTEVISLSNGWLKSISADIVQKSDYTLALHFTEQNADQDLTDYTSIVLKLNDAVAPYTLRATWNGTFDAGTGGTAKIEIEGDNIDFSGRYDAFLFLTDATGKETGPLKIEFTILPRGTGGVNPIGGVIDWSDITEYQNTASHGPVRPDGTTLETASTNADGSINLGVIDGLYDPEGSASTVQGNLDDHEADLANPHGVTKAQVGLSSADNTSDANKPVSTAGQTALDLKADDDEVVKLTGNQVIRGQKSLSYLAPDTFARLIVGDPARGGTDGYFSLTADTKSGFLSMNRDAVTGEASQTLVTNNVGQFRIGLVPDDTSPESGAYVIRDLVNSINRFWVSITDGMVRAVTGLITPMVRVTGTTASMPVSTDGDKNLVTLSKADFRALIEVGYRRDANGAISVGDLGGDARGLNALNIQSARSLATQVASGDYAAAIGAFATASGDSATAIGPRATASVDSATAIGPRAAASGDSATAIGVSAAASGDSATAIGRNVSTTVAKTAEIGYWSNSATRGGATRVHGETGMVALTLQDRATAYTDGGATDGSEADNTVMRNGYAIRRNGTAIFLDLNVAGTVTTLELGTAPPPSTNVKTDDYTLVLTDAGTVVPMNKATAVVLTIPTNASQAIPINTIINVPQWGAGVTTITAAAGVDLNGVTAGSGAISARYQGVTLQQAATDAWVMSGAHGTVA